MAPINNTMLPINLPSTPAIKYLLETSNKYIKLGEFSFAKCYLMMATAMAPENIHIKVSFLVNIISFLNIVLISIKV